jgi:hypothetical protein
MEEVRLPDLEVIRRFSIAVRSEHAPAADVVDALQTDLERIQRALRGRGSRKTTRTSPRSAPSRGSSSRKSGARRSPARKPRTGSKAKRPRSRRRR